MCIFCKIINNEIPSKKIYEDEDILAILDLSQATFGHTIVMPKKHCDNILDCPPDILSKIMIKIQELCKLYKEKLNCEGFNIVNNTNEVAGQTVMHLHIHIIPRYHDDKGKMLFLSDYEKYNITHANNDGKFNEGIINLDEVKKKILG